ncbi:diacylglycerol kinase catalytic domain protein [Hallella bergensis DSM 17361]|uniref:Diacylglycerol kinase catalytic domain protein n=1 Tax=Hallella bergensis DSM 17361 TaxID=585502 RepID=D1PT45_9BACT|nr:diacylglycerol kinase catalytic domain protein [Hallella bergensis DSM 17361]
MEENRWGIIYCPKSGLFASSARRWEKIQQCLKKNNIEYDHVQSESKGSVDRLVKMMINNGYHTIVIVGGDSALNDAVNCLMEVEKTERDRVVLGVIPNGMMNDFAHFWEFDEDNYTQTIKWLKKRHVRKIDLGCLRYTNKEGAACRRYFLNCVNVGLIASIMNLRRRTRHVFGSRTLSFLFSFILLLFQRMEYKMRIKINSDTIDRRVMTMCVGNALGYGQTPNAVPYNGQLDVSVAYHSPMTQVAEGIYLFVKGKILNYRSVHPYRTRMVRVENAENAMVGIDGRLMRTPVGPYTISVEEEVINFLIPS